MFLSIKEMAYSKGKFALIIFIMVLISWLVFILSGLANGLAQGSSKEVDSWRAEGIILTDEANKNLQASNIDEKVLKEVDAKVVEGIVQGSYAMQHENGKSDDKENISIFGSSNQKIVDPDITKGRRYEKKNEILVSQSLADKGYKIGDKVKLGSSEDTFTIVGITPTSSYRITPVIYASVATVNDLRFGETPPKGTMYNGIVYRDASNKVIDDKNLVAIKTTDFIEALPGYSEQKLTLNGMVYFLLVISAFVIGVFIYVMTLQKTEMFGILKIQGVATRYLAKSVLIQTFFLALIGVAVGAGLTYLTTLVLPASMPYATNLTEAGIYGIGLIIFAILGGVFSTITVAKVNPLDAIGG
ncbi:ABC transporter permease [Vagococcus sp. PNs007]|uniref:Putative hemin transport system permease protein HrtB n=1 Tax=Vagococcus proximus TaxID=2991417 RepID=A0ABT5X2Q3_9ENTE|nr:ABC transporter permease [Vagococcus proximus]MDF0480207.1 ABC transporter permease [Vagococcus proximus]